MTTTLTIRDEEMTGKTVNEFSLEFPTERITVRELIRSRVFQEVKDHNAKQNQAEFQGLVQPTDAERTLNGFRLKKARQIDWKQQFEKAVEAFENNQVLIEALPKCITGKAFEEMAQDGRIVDGSCRPGTFLRTNTSLVSAGRQTKDGRDRNVVRMAT